MIARTVLLLGLAAGAAIVGAPAPAGKAGFEQQCGGCHGLDAAKEGPALRHVFGRRAGTGPGYPYSAALKSANIVWNRATLDRWLTDPDTVAAGTDMAFRLEDKSQRAEIIRYLEQLAAPAK